MAGLYATQGLYDRAADIYARLVDEAPDREDLAEKYREVLTHLEERAGRQTATSVSREETLQVLYSDMNYALLRAKLMAEMVIGVIAATELLKQAGADPNRIDIAHAFVRRRMLDVEHKARRIVQNADGRLARDFRLLERIAPTS